MKRTIGAITLVAFAAEELIITAEHVQFLGQMMPPWTDKAFNQRVALPLFLLSLLFLLWRERKNLEDTPSTQNERTMTTQIDFRPHVEVNPQTFSTGGHAHLDATTAPDVSGVSKPLKPPIIFVRSSTIRVEGLATDQYDEHIRFGESNITSRPLGVLATFRAEHGASALVQIQLIYRDRNSHEVGDGVFGAYWIDNNSDMIDFARGQSHRLLIALVTNKGKCTPWLKRVMNQGGGEELHTKWYEWTDSISTVEIRLIGENGELANEMVELELETRDGKQIFIPKPRSL
ncbi:MAG TPA: hypothetical protein VFK06_01635 [Candidatus Angelobacter sp.]|nr:hypothetical protein [Candidatus Angelobacter sp.]